MARHTCSLAIEIAWTLGRDSLGLGQPEETITYLFESNRIGFSEDIPGSLSDWLQFDSEGHLLVQIDFGEFGK